MSISGDLPLLSESIPVSVQLVGIALVLGCIYFVVSAIAQERPWKGLPIAALTEEGLSPQESWNTAARKTINAGIKTFDRPFQVVTGSGPKIVLPNRYAEELKNHPSLSLPKAFEADFFAHLPGFEPFRTREHAHGVGDDFMPEVVRTKLTQSLGLVTPDLVEETTMGLHDIFGEDPEWHSVSIKQEMLQLVARLSSRVFLGKDLCRNDRWLEIARDYTVDSFVAARRLRLYNPVIRPFAHWFLKECKRIRQEMSDARKLIMPEVTLRTERARKALAAGQKPPKTADTIGWMVEVARDKSDKVDYVVDQMALTMAAIHTTTEGLMQALIDLLANPELIAPLREEIASVIGSEGWTKTALYKLRLMDSFLKESQRLHPPGIISMNRYITQPITLSTGEVLPAGGRMFVATRFDDPTAFTEPEKLDAYRFLRAREDAAAMDAGKAGSGGNANSNQHVSITPSHMAFGYGQHACPGRFFASNEMKIALAQWLIKYDVRPIGGGPISEEAVKAMRFEFDGALMVAPGVKMEVRRRVGMEEVSVDL